MKQDMIAILDLGCENNSRVARAVRALGVYSEVYPHDVTAAELSAQKNLRGIIICGGKNNIIDGKPIFAGDFVYSYPTFVISHKTEQKQEDAKAYPTDDKALCEMLSDFVLNKCGAQRNWNMKNFIDDQIEAIRAQVGDGKVLLALSGGVDSSVVAALLIRAIGKNLYCVHVNHGLMRKNESEQVVKVFREDFGANLTYIDATDRFLDKLAGVADPEQKRKIIGAEFIRVFEEEARKLDGIGFLGQGTIYPDIVESGTKTAKIVKSHHNVGGLPDDLKFELVEPLKYLFKDEVRAVGRELGLPEAIVSRQPFPGPGLGVRCLGAITRERLACVRESDAILREEFAKSGFDKRVWQYFTVVPDLKSVGNRGGERHVEYPVIIRAVNTIDAMTATIEKLPWDLLDIITTRILNEVPGVNRVLYDMSPKPPATIEWE